MAMNEPQQLVILPLLLYINSSDAILKYLSSRCQVAEFWYPRDLQSKARVDEFCAWQHTNLAVNASSIYQYQVS